MDEAFALAGRWVAAYLDEHPKASAQELVRDLEKLRSGTIPDEVDGGDEGDGIEPLAASAAQLADGNEAAYAVALSWNWSGTVVVVARQLDGSFGAAWSIRQLAGRNTPWSGTLERWAVSLPGAHDGPLAGEVLRLPDGERGEPRFLMDAESLPFLGVNRTAQASVWEWNGADAVPIFIRLYELNAEVHTRALDGDVVRLRVNEHLECFDVCGTCEGPQGVWSLRAGPDVEDLGVVPEIPELLLVDELLRRVAFHEDGSRLASRKVIARLQRQFAEIEARYEGAGLKDRSPSCFVGQVGDIHVERRPGGARLDVYADELGHATFQLERQGGELFITGVAEVPRTGQKGP